MATPTLDEIEARLNVQQSDLARDYQLAILALVAHVRAMNSGDSTRLVIVAEHTKRIAALEAKVAALEPLAKEARAAWKPVATEMDRLRAENGKLREENGSLHTAKIDWGQENAELRAENAELRKRQCDLPHCHCLTWAWAGAGPQPKGHHPHCDGAGNNNTVLPQWPAPQPIETAPLDDTIFVWPCGKDRLWGRDLLSAYEDVDEWRSALKDLGRTHWLPMPPPPGGGK